MTEPLFFDIETFSATPIRHGTHRYAEDAEIMLASYALGYDGEPEVTDFTAGEELPEHITAALVDPYTEIIGHNFGNFDRAVIRHAWGIEIDPARIWDTMVQAMSHGLPGGLDKLCHVMGVPAEMAKLAADGKSLIHLFCKPLPKNQKGYRATRHSHPEKWAQFVHYARMDIPPMQYLAKQMPKWNYPGTATGNALPSERALWVLDQKINDRGFEVDTELAEAAIRAVTERQRELGAKADEITTGDVTALSQRDRLLKHILSEYGVELPDMSKSTLERRRDDPDLPSAVRELINMRLESSRTSTAKYTALLNGVSADNRLRGTLQFCGAGRTGRWGGRLFQPQNLLRPSWDKVEKQIDVIETGVKLLKNQQYYAVFEDPIKLAANLARSSIVAKKDHKLVVADLSNIEGRSLAYLAREEWKLEAFRRYDAGFGEDLYKITAGNILGKKPEDVTDDERQSTGKVPELACGYQGALGAFQSMAVLYGLELEDSAVWDIVTGWRDENPAIVRFWYDMQDAAWECAVTGRERAVGDVGFSKHKAWLRMHLPSGRLLCYADPKIIPDPRRKGSNTLSYMGVNSYTRKWERITTYGGKLVENATQAFARDVIAEGIAAAEEAGYPVILSVHDEILTEVPDTGGYTVARLAELMSRRPLWAEGLPLAAAGFEAYRYRKG